MSANAKRIYPIILDWAADKGLISIIAKIRRCVGDSGIATEAKSTSLFHAARYGHTATAKLLLDMGAEINDNLSLPSLEAYSTLHHAVKSGNLETVELLLDHGADLNAKSSDGDFTHLEYEALTVLEYAALTGHLEISNLIISRGSKITEPLLGCAAFSGNVDLVRACLSKGAPLNGCDWENRTALHQAAIEGNIPIMKLFLEAGAQLDKRETRFGQTALLFAVQERRFEPIRLLLDYGADVDCPDSAGYTPLHVVVDNADVDSDKEYTQIVRLLLERGANVFATIITGILR